MNRTESLLLKLYNGTYGTTFVPDQAGEKLKMHKAVYLLQEKGVNCGDFDFFWHTNGPFSHELHKNLLKIESSYTAEEISANSDFHDLNHVALEAIEQLRQLITEENSYSILEWSETLGSLHYLKKHRYSYESDKFIIDKLVEEKPALSSRKSNKKALKLLISGGYF